MEVMIGTWAWGSGYNGSKMIFGQGYDEQILKDAFEKAVSLGFTKWDTAAVYGMGSCERLLGSFIKLIISLIVKLAFIALIYAIVMGLTGCSGCSNSNALSFSSASTEETSITSESSSLKSHICRIIHIEPE